MVCVCVRACMWSRVDCLVYFLPPKMHCAIYSAQLVCVCESHGFEYGCIELEHGSSTGSSPGENLVRIKRERKQPLFTKKKRCYSGLRHLPKIAILRPGCAIYRRYSIFCFVPSIFHAVHLSIFLSFFLSRCLSIYLSIHRSTYLSIYRAIDLSIFLPNLT
jgi:hypothetical protein